MASEFQSLTWSPTERAARSATLPADIAPSIEDMLEPGEAVIGAVTTLAGTLVVTDRNIVIVRQGRAWRPRTGIRTWAITPRLELHYGIQRGGIGRLMVGTGKAAASFFVKASDWDEALR